MLLRTYSACSIVLMILFLQTNINLINSLKCSSITDGYLAPPTPANGHFHLRIMKDTDSYVPGKTYTIKLEGIDVGHRSEPPVKYKFRGFMLEIKRKIDETTEEPSTAGTFARSHGDTLTQIACEHMVTHTNDSPKSEVTVEWTAPQSGCIIFQATIIETRDVWYKDGGPLTKEFCKQEKFEDQFSGPVICTACTEAKYELTFEGLWSRNTHPKDFPNNTFIPKFSDIIGASHTSSFTFWRYGRVATEGLREVAEFGSTTKLESELMQEISEIRTVIKAKGLVHPNVNGKTFAVFRVDQMHSQVSFVSSISPSPDWFVGVSGLELCTDDGGWVESKTIDVDLFDAGTDSGRTYESSNEPTFPPQAVQQIRSDRPYDPQSPFYDPESTMRPLARIYISRQRLYDKDCPTVSDDSSGSGSKDACAVGPWQESSECDAECGSGSRILERQYLNQDSAEGAGCEAELVRTVPCRGKCANRNDGDDVEETTQPSCSFTAWTKWGPCSPNCGNGHQTRTRQYVDQNRRRCEVDSQELVDRRPCSKPCSGEIPDLQNGKAEDSQEKDNDDNNESDNRNTDSRTEEKCKILRWSRYEQCSVACGGGVQVRTASKFTGNCEDSDKTEERECNTQACEVPEHCKEPPERGNCGSNITVMWYYNWDDTRCEQFGWNCGDHGNKFDTFEDCLQTCSEMNPYQPIQVSNKRKGNRGRHQTGK